MLPNLQQKIKLRTWFGIYRWIYNKGLQLLKSKSYQQGSLLKQFRERLVKNNNYQTQHQWVTDLPFDTRDYAIKELLQAFQTNLKSKHQFHLTFKSKKKSQSMEIRSRQYSVTRGKYKFLSEIRKTELIPELTHDIKVQMDTDGSFYLIIPMDVVRNENQVPHRIISIDPVIRTFMTGYTPDGYVYQIGYNDIGKLSRLLHQKNKLQGRITKHKRRNKWRIRRAFKRASKRIRNLVDECHKKVTSWLFQNFDYIILPKLETNSFCHKRMNKVVKNKIKVWRHCSLINRLQNKSREYPTVHLINPTEEYTSKTCSQCGWIDLHLGRKREYHCSKCDSVFDRDVNGSFNILLKYLTGISNDHPKEVLNLILDWI
jgi:putative transposase